MTRPIKVGMLVSYDYECIKNSLPLIYNYVDKIVLAVDKDNKTWAGNTFKISDTFWDWLKDYDKQHKVEIYKDSFYVEGLTSVQCDTRERTMLGKYMGEGGWHVQIDADEYFVDFKSFVDFLHSLDKNKKHINTVYIEWLNLYKRVPAGYLFIKGSGGGTAIATTKPENYICCRIVSHEKKIVYPQRIIHESFARTEEALLTKLRNWGHNNDFNIEGYFRYWKAIDEKNYMYARNFGAVNPETWKELEFIKAKDIPELLQYFQESKDSSLLKANKKPSKVQKLIRLCTPPLFSEISKFIKR